MRASYDAQRNEFSAYVLSEAETPFGMTLGNFKTFVTSTPKGGIRGLWDADTDQIIFGVHQIAYRLGNRETRFPAEIEREFTFLPYAQVSEFALYDTVKVAETFFVPHGAEFDRTVCFVIDVNLHNTGLTPERVTVFPWALLIGQRFYGEPEAQVRASVAHPYVRSFGEESGFARWWGGSRNPAAIALSPREGVLLRSMQRGSLKMEGHLNEVLPQAADVVNRRIFGALEYAIDIAPGARESLRLAVVFHKDGDAHARPVLERLLADASALHETQRYYARHLADACFMTPSPLINRGVVWAKCNMLRVIKEYPQGWGSTNSPPSDILVSRDTSWFVHGFDYFLPQFSRDAIEVFNRELEPSGQVVEYVRGVNGFKTSYDLNINDDTPLHLIAILHHFNATGDIEWLRSVYPLVLRVADYLLAQRDANGLVFCRASGVDMYGITSWRNIIPYYKLDGAVTEINAEAYFALEASAMISAVLDDRDRWEAFSREASALRAAMIDHLYNDDVRAFVLNYDDDGNYQDNFTADEVFPVLFNVADAALRRSILQRLLGPDFMTPVGLRTISIADAWYFPSHGFGLLGGVWPDLTLWFVVALAANGFEREAAQSLEQIYASMEAGASRNTVPGQFGEWFDGGSLTNRGMYLSPWTGAKFLWAVAETVCGIDGYRTSGRLHLVPRVPADWLWTAAVRVHWGGTRHTYVIDVRNRRIIGDMTFASADEPYEVYYAGRDVSDEATTSPADVAAIVFEDEAGGVRAYLANQIDRAREVTLEFRGRTERRTLAAGQLLELVLAGKPRLHDAMGGADTVRPEAAGVV
jgi:hypothetical protein